MLVDRLLAHLKELDRQVGELEARIKIWHKKSELSRKLEMVPGIGPITASALVATVGDAKSFENGRQLAAWLGLGSAGMSAPANRQGAPNRAKSGRETGNQRSDLAHQFESAASACSEVVSRLLKNLDIFPTIAVWVRSRCDDARQ